MGKRGWQNDWTDEEWQNALRLLATGLTDQQVACRLNRAVASLRDKRRYERMTPQERAERRERINARRRKDSTYRPATFVHYQKAAARPTSEMFAERDRYLYAPRTISQAVLGDPPPGYSALDRKRAEARASHA